MTKFVFKCEHPRYDPFTYDKVGVSATVTHEFEEESLNKILEQFESFLRGCGFHFNGQLDFVDEPEFNINDDSITIYGENDVNIGFNDDIFPESVCSSEKCEK